MVVATAEAPLPPAPAPPQTEGDESVPDAAGTATSLPAAEDAVTTVDVKQPTSAKYPRRSLVAAPPHATAGPGTNATPIAPSAPAAAVPPADAAASKPPPASNATSGPATAPAPHGATAAAPTAHAAPAAAGAGAGPPVVGHGSAPYAVPHTQHTSAAGPRVRSGIPASLTDMLDNSTITLSSFAPPKASGPGGKSGELVSTRARAPGWGQRYSSY